MIRAASRLVSPVVRTTLAAVLEKVGQPIVLRELRLAALRAREAVIRVSRAGVCGSDASVLSGKRIHRLPVVLGHEGSGVVVQTAPGVKGVRVGQRVAFNWQPRCSNCYFCRLGQENLCSAFPKKITRDTARFFDGRGGAVYSYSNVGCFADHLILDESCLIPVPNGVSMGAAALIGCATATGIGAVDNVARIFRGATVLITGAGGVGLNSIFAARRAGAKVIVVEQFAAKAGLAREFGATHFLRPTERTVAQIHRLTSGRGVDVAIEATGRPEMQELTLMALRPGGTAVWVGLPGSAEFLKIPARRIPGNDLIVRGALYGSSFPREYIARLLREARRGKLPLDRLVSRTYRLDRINDAFADLRLGRVARGLIEFPT